MAHQMITPRLLLRGHKETDFPLYWEMLNDEQARKYTGGVTKLSYTARERLFWEQCASFGTGDGFEFAVEMRESGEYCGYCGFRYSPLLREMELLYGFRRQFWGAGIATEAAQAALEYGFSALGFARVAALANPENTASWRVLEKLGMARAGTLMEDGQELLRYELKQ